MNERIFGTQVNTPDSVEQTDPDANNPVVENSDSSASKTPVLANLIYGTPNDGSIHPTNMPEETIVDQTTREQTIPYNDPDSRSLAQNNRPIAYTAPEKQPVGYVAPQDQPANYTANHFEKKASEVQTSANAELSTALLNHDESALLRVRWNEIQGKFVDEPRLAVQQADTLLADVIEKITQVFANEHSTLEGQWKQGNDVSTEDLRKALQHYRSFFNRLVA